VDYEFGEGLEDTLLYLMFMKVPVTLNVTGTCVLAWLFLPAKLFREDVGQGRLADLLQLVADALVFICAILKSR
jgi:hypothetical protein